MHKYALSLAISLFALSFFAFSLENDDNYNVKIPEFTSTPKIDGKLENPIWQRDESGIFRREGRYYFIKFSYWWRT